MMGFRRFVIAIAATIGGAILVFWATFPYSLRAITWVPVDCGKELLLTAHGMAGRDFEVRNMEGCDPHTEGTALTVFASRPGWWSPKTVVFQYDPGLNYPSQPDLELVGPHVVRISTGRIASVLLARRDWDGLEIEYAIEDIGVSGPNDPPNAR
jgi:hypothetical protein